MVRRNRKHFVLNYVLSFEWIHTFFHVAELGAIAWRVSACVICAHKRNMIYSTYRIMHTQIFGLAIKATKKKKEKTKQQNQVRSPLPPPPPSLPNRPSPNNTKLNGRINFDSDNCGARVCSRAIVSTGCQSHENRNSRRVVTESVNYKWRLFVLNCSRHGFVKTCTVYAKYVHSLGDAANESVWARMEKCCKVILRKSLYRPADYVTQRAQMRKCRYYRYVYEIMSIE